MQRKSRNPTFAGQRGITENIPKWECSVRRWILGALDANGLDALISFNLVGKI